MGRPIRRTAWIPLLLALFGAGAAAADPTRERDTIHIESLSWMAGCWRAMEDTKETVECWTAPAGGLMLALHREIDTGAKSSGRAWFEYLRIVRTPEGLVYLASPGGKPATPFPLSDHGEKSVTFANPEHDFPQRISYRLDAEGKLVARVEGEVDGETRGSEWTWSSAEFPD